MEIYFCLFFASLCLASAWAAQIACRSRVPKNEIDRHPSWKRDSETSSGFLSQISLSSVWFAGTTLESRQARYCQEHKQTWICRDGAEVGGGVLNRCTSGITKSHGALADVETLFRHCFPHLPVVNKLLRFWPSQADWNWLKLKETDWTWLKLIENDRKSIETDWKSTRIWVKTIQIAENWLRRFRM